MFFQISRRRLVKVSALLFMRSGNGSVTSLAHDLILEPLRLRRAQLLAQCEELDRRWLEAKAMMPWYWQPGVKFRNDLGEAVGPRVGWPDAQGNSIELADGLLLVRPSVTDLRELFDCDLANSGREIAVTNYRMRFQKLRTRLRDRRRYQAELGMPQTSDWQQLDAEVEAIDRLIAQHADDA